MPSGAVPNPILYQHVFGDWYMGMDYVNVINPYTLSTAPSQTPPLGNLFFFLLSGIGPKYAYLFYLCLATFLWVSIFRRVFKSNHVLFTVLASTCYVFVTLPAIISFDRGSLHYLAFALIGVAWIAYQDNKLLLASFTFICAISMKPQLALILLLLLANKEYLRIFKVTVMTIGINLILLVFYEGSITATFAGYIKATLFFTSANASGYMLDSASLTGFFLRRIENRKGSDFVSNWILNNEHFLSLIGLALILIMLPLLFSKFVSQRVKVFLVLSLTSLVVPVSMAYTMMWGSLAIIAFISDTFDFKINSKKITKQRSKRNDKRLDQNLNRWKLSDFTSFICITLILTPSFMYHWTGARNISFARDRYQYLVLAVVVLCYFEIFKKRLNIRFFQLISEHDK
jgi:hypothetical protein